MLRTFLFFLVLITSSTAKAESITFRTLDLAPWGYTDSAGNSKGILYEVANLIIDESTLKARNWLEPMARVIEGLKKGQKGCTIVTRSPYSESFSEAIADIKLQAKGVIFTKRNIKLKTYKDIEGLLIGITRGSHFDHTFDQDTFFRKRFTNNDRQTVLMFQRDRVDAIAGPLSGFLFNMKQVGFDQNSLSEPLILVQRDFWFHCEKQTLTETQKSLLQKTVKDLVQSGRIQAIWDSYLN